MPVGIEHSKKVMRELGDVAEGVIRIVKHRTVFGAFPAIVGLFGDVKDLLQSAPQALPELADVDQAEVGALAAEAYVLVRRVIAAVAAA